MNVNVSAIAFDAWLSPEAQDPEATLLAWLLWLPPGQDPGEAACRELRRPAFDAPACVGVERRQALLREVADGGMSATDRRAYGAEPR